jgi:hypothetical protein
MEIDDKREFPLPCRDFSLCIMILETRKSECTLQPADDSSKKKKPYNPVGLRDVEDPTLYRQSAHRRR